MYTETADSLDLRIQNAATDKYRSEKEEASQQEMIARTEAAQRISEILQRQVAPTDLGLPLAIRLDEPFVYEPVLAGRRFQIEVRGAQQRVTVKIRNRIAAAEVHSLADFPVAERTLRKNTQTLSGIYAVIALLFVFVLAVPLVVHFMF